MTELATSSLEAGPMAKRREIPPAVSGQRLKKRYSSERLFKFLGVAALALTGVFLIILLSNIVWNAVPAFSEHQVALDVAIDPDVVDPEGKGDHAALKNADYAALVRRALETAIPGVEGRTARKSLNGLISSGAAADLRDRVIADPSIIGKTVKARLLLSDDADLYFKQVAGKVDAAYGSVEITPSAVKGAIALKGPEGAFANFVNEARLQGAEANAETGDVRLDVWHAQSNRCAERRPREDRASDSK